MASGFSIDWRNIATSRVAGPVRSQQHDPIALADELLAGLEQQPAIGGNDGGIIQRNQNLGVRSAVGELDGPCGALQVSGLCRTFQLRGSLLQLLGFLQQKVAAGIDADIVELCSVLTQLLRHLQVTPVAPFIRCVRLAERGARLRIGQRKYRRSLGPQKYRAVRGGIEKGAVMARYHDRHFPWQRVQPGFKLTNPGEVQMVGRLVEQQHIGLRHHDAGKHGKPLPAAAQLLQRPLPQRLRHLKRFQGNIDPPAFTCASFNGKHVQHRRMK